MGDSLFGGLLNAPDLGAALGVPALAGLDGLTGCKIGIFAPIACDQGLTDVSGNIHQILYETQVTKSTAVFAQMDYDLTDQLTLTAGVRWTKEEKDFIAGQSYLTSPDRESCGSSQSTQILSRNGRKSRRGLV